MPTDIDPRDYMVFAVVVGLVILAMLVVDFIIFCYWLSFKYKEYSYQQMYGPVLKFPPRESGNLPELAQEQTSGIAREVEFAPNVAEQIPEPTSPQPSPDPSYLGRRGGDARSVPSPNAEQEIPSTERQTPNAERQTPPSSAAPAFDFLPPPEVADEQLAPPPSMDTRDSEKPLASLANGEPAPGNEVVYPPESVDPLEDTRPIDPIVLGGLGGIRSPFASTWSLVHPYIGIQVVLVVVGVLQTVLLLPKMFTPGAQNVMTTPYGLAVIIGTLFAQNVGFVGLTAFLVKSYGTSLRRIGLRMPTGREILLGLVFGAGLCVVAVLLEKGIDIGASHIVSKQFMDRMGKLNEGITAGGTFEQIHSVPIQVWFILAGAVAAPIGEEVFFRGLLYNGLKKRWGVTAGVLVSGVCFGLIHFSPLAIIVIIPMGCILALVYERTKSLWVTILMHAVNNGAQLVVAMYAMNHVAGH